MSIQHLLVVADALAAVPASADPVHRWIEAWPRTDFARSAVPLAEIRSGGPERDGIPSIDAPRFVAVTDADVPDVEPVVSVVVAGDARAYPLRILIWHQIVNDLVGGLPVAVTYCPLCNAAIVFDRRVDGRTVSFGSTGLVRHSDLVMYDRQTESWWQQYEGQGIVGAMAGVRLLAVPARLEAMGRFAERFPQGRVLVPPDETSRPYGRNPYTGYDSMPTPYNYDGPLPEDIAPLARVVSVGTRAWSLALIRARGTVEVDDLLIEWTPGQSSALDAKHIADGRDVGNVVVRRRQGGGFVDVAYTVGFAFVFKAFHPDAAIVVD
jgi:hypothetical protein